MMNTKNLGARRAYTCALATALQLLAAGCDSSFEITVNITGLPPQPPCGDGQVGPEEECDDATTAATATSTTVPPCASCRPAAAGSCKPARRATSAKATTTLVCLQADCGDGFVQTGEQCDDSNGGQTDACLATCESAACGDGFVWAGHEQCDDGNLVGGDGCNADCTQPRRVFITSLTYSANMGGVAGAASRCQTRANAAGLGGTWDAWIGSDSSTPRTRFTPSTTGYARLDGVMVANDWADLLDGSLDATISFTEIGTFAPLGVWTGTEFDGTASTNTCSNWTTNLSSSHGGVGHGSYANSAWAELGFSQCNSGPRLYCFEQ